MLNFDDIDDWAPKLTAALALHVPSSVGQKLAAAQPEFIEDAQDILFDLTSGDELIETTINWIGSTNVAGYHGSRLTDTELESVREDGLIPLEAEARRGRLVRVLSDHPEWTAASKILDATLEAYGRGGRAGNRQNQVHLTLSRAGLTKGFNHYLTHGAEFDQRVVHELLGTEGKELLRRHGKPRVVQLAIPGSLALEAAHPHFSVEDMRNRGELPNIVREFLQFWSFKLAYPEFQSRSQRVDCGMVFRSIVPAAWIISIDTLAETYELTAGL